MSHHINTEIHCLLEDDSMIVAQKTSDTTIFFQFYASTTEYQNNIVDSDLHLPHDFLNEILRVFPCTKL